jgi:microcystin-dependent protein
MSFLTVSAIVPPATVLPYAAASAPEGWLICDGSAVSRSTYANLFAAIGTTYGSGDGLTTFNLPNTQGIFLRGAGSQIISGITYNGTRGTSENDNMQGHWHELGDNSGNVSNSRPSGTASGGPTSISGSTTGGGFSVSRALNFVNNTVNGSPRSGNETRPANISVNYIIKI